MQRYFISDECINNELVKADAIMHKHIAKVMRQKEGNRVICIDSHKHVYLCEIIDIEEGLLKIVETLDDNHELDVDVTLVYGLPKGDKFEKVIQKATELGVTRIVPFLSRRSLIKVDEKKWEKKAVRYQRIIQEAAEQSYRLIVPELTGCIKMNQLADYVSEVNLVAYEESAKEGEQSTFKQAMNRLTTSITIVVGPEGGFDEEEVEEMKKMGFEACGLGKRILRSETAPLYMLSVIGYERELNCEGRREDK